MEEQKKRGRLLLPLILLAAVLAFVLVRGKLRADVKKLNEELTANRVKTEELEARFAEMQAEERSLTAEVEKLRSETDILKQSYELWKGKKEWIETLK